MSVTMMWLKLIAVSIVLLLFALWSPGARAQEHHGHPPEDHAIHEKFYKNWMQPDNRSVSCCHDEDCKPSEARRENGHWIARQIGDEGSWTIVPASKVEYDRDTPDGRSHMCGRRYGFNNNEFSVFCFIAGSGG